LSNLDRTTPMFLPEEMPLPGLNAHTGLDEVEAMMLALGVGKRLARAGVMAQELLATGGKRVRARLALAAGEALGLQRDDLIAWAAACELLHNATIVHDDIQDGDMHRRGEPTTWVRHGVPQAINAGDLLLMLPFRALEQLEATDQTRWRLSRAIARSAEAAVRGQSFEMDLLGGGRFSWDDWTRAASGKTGALLALPVEGAAILAGLDAATSARLGAEFATLGLIFQLNDDILDISSAKGRPAGSDLAAGKVSALVVAHLAAHPEDTVWLNTLLTRPRGHVAPEDVALALQKFCLSSGGAVEAVRARADALGQSIRTSQTLRAIPDLHALAIDLLTTLVRP